MCRVSVEFENSFQSFFQSIVKPLRCVLASVMLLVGITTVGCASLDLSNMGLQGLQMPEHNLTTTGVGAVAGAVVGAGLGLAVGSATGNAGEGFLIGSIAGASTGGIIGREFERHENSLAQQDEAIQRQDELLQKQRREIDKLKRSTSDISSASRVKSFAEPQRVMDSYSDTSATSGFQRRSQIKRNIVSSDVEPDLYAKNKPSRRISGFQGETFREEPVRSLGTMKRERAYDSIDVQRGKPFKAESAVAVIKPVVPTKLRLPRTVAVAHKSTLNEVKKTTENVSIVPPPKRARLNETISAPLPVVITKKKAVVDSQMASSVLTDSGCREAETEARRAKTTTSDADKLFYLRRAIRLCPKQDRYHLDIGQVYVDIGRVEDAEYEFRQVLDLNPGNQKAKEQLDLLAGSGEDESVEAIEDPTHF